MSALAFPRPAGTNAAALRAEVRAFLAAEMAAVTPWQRAASWSAGDQAFSRKMAAKGWIGMTWPRQYGGHERSAVERYVVLEEMLAAGAPVGFHWVADRQSGPALLRHGTEAQRQTILPRIAAGECGFCIGMSEPDSGSDLAAARTTAIETPEGWLVNGTKVWTSGAHVADYMILFCRTPDPQVPHGPTATGPADRHAGSSQFLVDMAAAQRAGMVVRPILDMAGEHHFNEVVFVDVLLPPDALLGIRGQGWAQVTGELAYERSGPERFLSSFSLLTEAVRHLGQDRGTEIAVGRLCAHLAVLRRLSLSVAGMLQAGADPALQAALVKDLGNTLEQEVAEVCRLLLDVEAAPGGQDTYAAMLAQTIMIAPSFSLRGGTREILRGMIARGLGLR